MQTATTSPSSPAGSSISSRHSATPWPLVIAAALMLYTFGVGGALLGDVIDPDRAWILMAIPCLVPMTWCVVGFFRNARDGGEKDGGLLLSAIGWALIFAALVAKYFAVIGARPDAYASQESSPITPLSAGLGVLCLLLGAALSFLFWQREVD